jgi:hypothetical protein
MGDQDPKHLDYERQPQFKLIRVSRRALLIVLSVLVALALCTFLPIWPATGVNGTRWRTTLWKSNVFVIYD